MSRTVSEMLVDGDPEEYAGLPLNYGQPVVLPSNFVTALGGEDGVIGQTRMYHNSLPTIPC